MEQLDNIAAILKNYPDVRIRIGGLRIRRVLGR